MNHHHTTLTRGPLAAFWALASLAALFTAHPAVAADSRVDVKFRFAAYDAEISGIYFDTGGKPVSAEAHQATISPWYSYSGPSTLTLYRPGTDADGKPMNTTVATIDLSNAPKVPLIMLITNPSDTTKFVSITMDDNYTDFPWGSIAFYNFTHEDDVVGLGDNKKTVKSFDHVVLKPADKDQFFLASVIRVGAQDNSQLLGDSWPNRPDFRRLVYVLAVPDAGGTLHYNVKWVDEQNLPPQAAPKPGSSTTGRTSGGQQGGGQQQRNNNAGG